jgi:hypothetical protein
VGLRLRVSRHPEAANGTRGGSAGLLKGNGNLRLGDGAQWDDFHDRIEAAARLAGGD